MGLGRRLLLFNPAEHASTKDSGPDSHFPHHDTPRAQSSLRLRRKAVRGYRSLPRCQGRGRAVGSITQSFLQPPWIWEMPSIKLRLHKHNGTDCPEASLDIHAKNSGHVPHSSRADHVTVVDTIPPHRHTRYAPVRGRPTSRVS